MPRATVSQDTIRIELKTCPPDGFVELRTLTFHEMNSRLEIAGRMYQEQQTPKRGMKQKQPDTVRSYMEIANTAVTEYEFRNCIVNHNLEDENGDPIDFTRPMQYWRLDPKVGQEIDDAITNLNQWEDDDTAPLLSPVSSFSQGERGTSSPSTDET